MAHLSFLPRHADQEPGPRSPRRRRERTRVSDTGSATANGGTANSGILINITLGFRARSGPRRPSAAPYTSRELDDVADRLAETVRRQLENERVTESLSVRISKTVRPDVAHYDDAVYPDEPAVRLWESGFSSGCLGALADAFEELPNQRLVILGGPGAGKTELATGCAFVLLERRRRRTTTGPGGPVPVLLSLSEGNPDAKALDAWIADQLAEKYGRALGPAGREGEDVARELVAGGRVLPVLDGLDAWAGSSPDTVSQLNDAGRRVILTCRAEEYEPTVTGTRDDGTYHRVLTGAPVIELLPLRPDEIEQYLRTYTPPGKVGKWDRVFARLREHPGGPLAQALSTPLTVWLARTVYAGRSDDPSELLDPDRFGDRASLEGHLLDQLIPAVYAGPGSGGSRRADEAQRWLGFLASLLRHLGTGGLAWWELTRVTPRLVTGLAAGVLGCVLAGLGVVLGVVIGRGSESGGDLAAGIQAAAGGAADVVAVAAGLGVVAGLVTGLSGWQEAKAPPLPVTLVFRARGKAKPVVRRLADGVGLGLRAACVFGGVVVLLFGFRAGLSVSLVAFVVVPLAFGTSGIPWFQTLTDTTRAALPSSVLKQDRRAALVNMAGTGLVAGVLAAFIVKVLVRPTDLLPALVAGFTIGTGAAVVRGTRTAWGHFLLARAWLAGRGRLPWRLMGFLDDAYGEEKKVLRRVGGVYQFRHALHQDRLADWSERSGWSVPLAGRSEPGRGLVLAVALCVLLAPLAFASVFLRGSRTADCDTAVTVGRSPTPPSVTRERRGCVLRPSTSVFKNHLDKIDLDTGEPGRGGTGVLIGYAREGRLADIIVNPRRISSAKGGAAYAKAGHGREAGYEECRSALGNEAARSTVIAPRDLRKGDQLCVGTDEGRIAVVRVLETPAGPSPRLEISFRVWDE